MAKQSITMEDRIKSLYKKHPVMEKLKRDHVFSVEDQYDSIMISEECDGFFSSTLSKEEVKSVIAFFSELYKFM